MYILEILTRPHRDDCSIRGRDNSFVKAGCSIVVDEEMVLYLEDERVVGGDGW